MTACLKDQRIDSWCEEPRTEYLSVIIDLLTDPNDVLSPVGEKLERSRSGGDQDQMLKLGAVYALRGDQRFCEVIPKVARRNAAKGNHAGVYEWTQIEGKKAFWSVAVLLDRYVDRFVESDNLLFVAFALSEGLGERRFRALLGTARKRSHGMARLADEYFSRLHPKAPRTPLSEFKTFDSISQSGPERKTSKRILTEFAQFSEQSEFEIAAAHLPESEAKRAEYIDALFTKRAFPGDPNILMRDAKSKLRRLRLVAFRALGRIRSDEVRRFALKTLKSKRWEGILACDVLVTNYMPGDEDLILARAKQSTSDWDLHRSSRAIINLLRAETRVRPELAFWVYDNVTCGICRFFTVRLMLERNWLSEEIREECRYDSESETRGLVEPRDEGPQTKDDGE